MFFDNRNFFAEILSVLELSWDAHVAVSDHRPFHALSFRITGDTEMISEDGTVSLTTRDMVFVPAGKIYTMKTAKHEHLFVIHFSSDIYPIDKICKFTSKNPNYFENKFRDLYIAWNKKQRGYEFECRALFYKILFAMEREVAEEKCSITDDKISEAEEYIRENFSDKTLNVDELAKRCAMSDTYFRRLFCERFGITPLKYINNLRLSYAKELLESGYYTVGEVAEKCGFNNINYFSTFIKKELGTSPKNI